MDGRNQRDLSAYSRIIEWSIEDQTWIGRCPALFDGGCHGDSRETVAEKLEVIIADICADYVAANKSLPLPS